MNRVSFLRSLFLVVASPKVLAEIRINPPQPTATLFKDLQVMKPHYYRDIVAKYGNGNFDWWIDEVSKKQTALIHQFYHFETNRIVTSTTPIVEEPVTITITN